MIPGDVAAAHLTPVADPTMSAFTEARQQVQRAQEATAEGRALCDPPRLGLIDGVDFWGFFSGHLVHRYAQLPNVVKHDDGHVLTTAWTIDDVLTIHLKSDVTALDVEQLMIPGIEKVSRAAPDIVALTWEHAGAERFGPAFVHVTPKGQMWRIPVASLLEEPVAPVPVILPKPQLTSKTVREQDAQPDAK